uniref:Fumarylacetoacetase-like C-terminal domain-containing protein n=1 Tax=Entomoneis paludosa TaxID=265537 RepID=A0A7S2Y9A4_9STRA|mmetsp:Transcript_23472/g.48735  ORF Transcript_23472/g.48735 Transcript_23472/m.48735 type:complete len:221 (+) Transcript_23472:244-906(+)
MKCFYAWKSRFLNFCLVAYSHGSFSNPCLTFHFTNDDDDNKRIELVVAIGQGGVRIEVHQAMHHIYGFAVGVDLTRRDLQAVAKQLARPWDSAKAFDHSAPVSSIVPLTELLDTSTEAVHSDTNHWIRDLTSDTTEMGLSPRTKSPSIWILVNGEERQRGSLEQMTWSVPEIISILSQQFHLQPGDLIFTGTPAGVGPLQKGDLVQGGVDGLNEIQFNIS